MKVVAWPARKNADRNPYQRLLYDAVEAEGVEVVEFTPRAITSLRRGDVLHLHWPDVYLAAGQESRFWLRLVGLRGVVALSRLRGASIVWTAHNLRRATQRNKRRLDHYFWDWFLGSVDGVIFMTSTTRKRALATEPRLDGVPSALIPHGHYRPVIPTPSLSSGRPFDKQPLTATFFGSVTAYKGVHRLMRAFADVPDDAALQVLGAHSAQSPDLQLPSALAAMTTEQLERVHVRDEFLSQDELCRAILQSDLVVLPYDEVDNSGAAVFALSVGRPILVSDTALFRDLEQTLGADWVWIYRGELTGDVLARSLARARSVRLSGAEPNLSPLDWHLIGSETARFLADVTARKR